MAVLLALTGACTGNDGADTEATIGASSEMLGTAGTFGSGGHGFGEPEQCLQQQVTRLIYDNPPGYDGQRDAEIAKQTPDSHIAMMPYVDNFGDVGNGKEQASLFRWDLTSLPLTGVTVCSAQIAFRIIYPSADAYHVNLLKRDWDPEQVTWNRATATQAWALPGARGVSDRGDLIGDVVSTAPHAVLNIPPSYVQDWINHPAANHGIIVSNRTSGALLELASRANGNSAGHPELILKTVGP